ncbi:MAG: CoA transferase, partial [Chloroflexi bacterium]|nr:CoA transferase [Chloroflexota bacterium]
MRVLDLTRAVAGPYCTLLLAGLGAEVIKLEDPDGGDFMRNNAPFVGAEGAKLERTSPKDLSAAHLDLGRNKYSVTLNLKHPASAQIFADLLRQANVVVENFSPATADRLGVGYEVARSINPSLVYTSVSGFGPGTPEGFKAMDIIVEAMSGVMLAGADEGPPVKSGVPVGDLLAGTFATIATLAALRQAETSGIGQHIDVSMLGALGSFVAHGHPGITDGVGRRFPLAPRGLFECRDGWMVISSGQDKFTRAFVADAMSRPDLLEDPRYRTPELRAQNARALNEEARAWAHSLAVAEALARLERAGVPGAAVRGPREAVADPLTRNGGGIAPLVHPLYGAVADVGASGLPIVFSEAATGLDRPAAYLGEHNVDIYCGLLAYSEAQLAAL